MNFLQHIFEEQVKTNPHNIALICQDIVLTYQDLNYRANQWANLLQTYSIKPGEFVAVLAHPSMDAYAAMLGILKAGAVYLPIDHEYPKERIEFMLKDSNARLVITSADLSTKFQCEAVESLNIDDLQKVLTKQNTYFQDSYQNAVISNLCYVIYTSGTTGKPKGVGVTHANIANYLEGVRKVYGITKQDRVYQGFSLAFDASLEEIWSAFSSGATLVVGAASATHAGANLVEFLNLHKITVFSTVPTLLSLLDGDIPSLRLLILGGEICPPKLVEKWSRPDLRIINTYGPTEATIIATYHECRPNQTITIGKPLANCKVVILNENLEIVPRGEVGELFIGGAGVASGYLNNPELTEKKFIKHPQNPELRLYRTGDLVYETQDGELQFVGRADEQIKLRGYRIELNEIEAIIEENQSIRKAVVAAQELSPGVHTLVCYIIMNPSSQFDQASLNRLLHSRLPEYMIPTLFELVESLPMLSSGKVDRKNLPKPTLHIEEKADNYQAPSSTLEQEIIIAWEELFKHKPISVEANFFHDLGGHSLLAAQAVSNLRKNLTMSHASMLDLYENPTARKLAERLAELSHQTITPSASQNVHQEAEAKINKRYRLCTIFQAFGCYLQFALQSWPVFVILFCLNSFIQGHQFWSFAALKTIAALILLIPPSLFAFAIASKWLLLGRVKPGRYKLWSWFYFKWWLALKIQGVAPVDELIGSPLVNLYARLMGAKIGRNCYIGSADFYAFDLLYIGHNSSIGYDAMLPGYTVENGWLKIGSIHIGERSYVGARSVVEIDTILENDACLDDLSMLSSKSIIFSGQTFAGSPARFSQKQKKLKKSAPPIDEPRSIKNIAFFPLYYLGLLFITSVYYAASIPGLFFLTYLYDHGFILKAFLIGAPVSAFMFLNLFCLAIFLSKKALVGTVKPGQYKIKSLFYLRYWILQRLAKRDIEVFADSLYFPWYLRMLGAKIGKRVEIAELPHVDPDLLEIHDESFIASSVAIGVPRIFGGYINFKPTLIHKRSFVGNSALIPAGTELGEECLIGCLSIPPNNTEAKQQHTSWFGSPAVYLPRREIFEGFSEKETFRPSKFLVAQRLLIETIRILAPSTCYYLYLVGLFCAFDLVTQHVNLINAILLFPAAALFSSSLIGMAIIGFKWLFIGKLKESAKPVWSRFIWKYDIFVHLFNSFLGPMILFPFLGTPFAAPFLRALGAKIGKRVFINTLEFTETDLTEIGDDVALNSECIIQTHLYEDRIFKMSRIHIDDQCNIGTGSIVLYNTVMEKGSSLGSLSLLMKGEILPHHSYWVGIPAQHPVSFSFATILKREVENANFS